MHGAQQDVQETTAGPGRSPEEMALEELLADAEVRQGLTDHAHVPDRVAEILRRLISSGEILPGTKVPEVRTTQLLGVSRHTLRAAFQSLAAEGLLERRPNRGVFVHAPTTEDIRETYRVRRVVELGAVRQADFDDAALAELEAVIDVARRASAAGDLPAVAQANQQLHRLIIAQVGSEQLSAFMEQILARMRLVFHTMRGDPTFHIDYVERNARLVELLQTRDGAAAEEHLAGYFDVAEEQLLENLG
ncbi:GntR family transcriptional regulator [Nesterenkonia sp. HG001]|uniref:GntR family transcriptional regulator n=1 Tax=Nesterenkonia sp. HG001 TaxID=2983207 RepID=UPI002AC7D52D|nr:GntR family transcriptional regulator [Nesterenkonia sp. HG001]MDZ5077757.1 GntR family transcriptional regulator [Nesterenkonia sp. HG001]